LRQFVFKEVTIDRIGVVFLIELKCLVDSILDLILIDIYL